MNEQNLKPAIKSSEQAREMGDNLQKRPHGLRIQRKETENIQLTKKQNNNYGKRKRARN